MLTEITTYDDLLKYLQSLTPEQLAQTISVAEPSASSKEVVELLTCFSIGTVAEAEFEGCRSHRDNKYHGDEIVLLTDCNPFADDGTIAYELSIEDPDTMTPVYGAHGKTRREDQLATKS